MTLQAERTAVDIAAARRRRAAARPRGARGLFLALLAIIAAFLASMALALPAQGAADGVDPPAGDEVVGVFTYMVQPGDTQPGDTPSVIAARHGTTVDAIVDANHPAAIGPGHLIRAGATLAIPLDVRPATETYTVQPGDTLSAIARAHDTAVDALVEANAIADPDLISVGQVLEIPR